MTEEQKAAQSERMKAFHSAKKEAQGDTITMSKADLEATIASYMAQNNELKERNAKLERVNGEAGWKTQTPATVKTHTATLKRWQVDSEKPMGLVVDWKFHKNVFDELSRRHDKPVYKVTLRYDDGTTSVEEILWEDFAKIVETEVVDILDKKVTVLERVTGKKRTNKKMVDGYLTELPKERASEGMIVDLKETRDEIMMTVKRPNGQVFDISATRLNA